MKILLVEDDPSITKVITWGLKNERIDVDTAPNGTRGLRLAASQSYDLIVLDLMLPEKNGDEVLRQLRFAKHTVPIIVVTGITDMSTKVRVFGLGADDYVTKPFEFTELMARIRASLRKHNVEVLDTITFEDITIDFKAHQVTRRGKLVPMREKEIKLLEYLIRHEGQVLTRDMIMNYVWGPTIERYTNVVDVHIHHLREKIDKPYSTTIIKTVNNVGYKISRDAD
jgi:DNA-binding response OmpR family regulator